MLYKLKKVKKFILFLLWTSLVFSDGIIIPHPPSPEIKPIPLSVDFHNVSCKIKEGFVKTTVYQAFLNDYNQDIEGTYIFPLPKDASISSFSLFSDGKKIEGEILDKDKARKIYEDIVRRLKDPGLLEYIGGDLFKARVYPIPAKGKKEIEISYEELLKADENVFRYRYPLDVEKYSPKPIREVLIDVEIESSIPIKNIYSPTHNIKIEKKEDYYAKITYKETNTKPDSDFILYYSVDESFLGASLLSYRDEDDGYFLFLASPKEKEEPFPKDITFTIDTSGSMRGEKLKQAKNALIFCIDSLNLEDRFNIIRFSSDVESLFEDMEPSEWENKNKAKRFIEDMSAGGGTNINDALISSFIKVQKRPHIIIFLTDGIPTVGERNVDLIIKNVSGKNKGSRIFVFGVGDDVNTRLLDTISQENKGFSTYVSPDEDIEGAVSGLYKKVENPAFSDISLFFSPIKIYDLYPKKLPDLFFGSQFIVLGRYKDYGMATVTVSGKMKEEIKTYEYNLRFSKKETKNDFIPRLWATRKIGYLLDQIRLFGESKEIIDEIITLSKKYGIITPYTSFLVVEEEPKRIEERFRVLSKTEVGATAVKDAKKVFALKEETLVKPSVEQVKYIGKDVYILKDGIWQDINYSDEETKKIKYESKDYFDMLNEDLARVFSLGKNIIFKYRGVWYQIID